MSVEVFGEQRCRQVALTEVGEDDDDALAGVLRTRSDLLSRNKGSTRRDSDKQTLLLGDLAGPLDGDLVIDVDDLVVDLSVEDARHEVRTQTRDGMRASSALGQQRRGGGFDGDDLDLRQRLTQSGACAGDGAAGADAGNEDVDLV